MTIDEELQALFDKADEIIEKEVIELAMLVLRENTQLHEFIMAMGSFFFTLKKGKNAHNMLSTKDEIASLKGGSALWKFVYKWDDQFKVTGTPMRFSLRSGIKRDW